MSTVFYLSFTRSLKAKAHAFYPSAHPRNKRKLLAPFLSLSLCPILSPSPYRRSQAPTKRTTTAVY
ncbi:hypothetical protein I3843_08G047600 [Carya illinoinensis]|nr:hypothetical protein I3843_08G047600 [Carya illinoinensis]